MNLTCSSRFGSLQYQKGRAYPNSAYGSIKSHDIPEIPVSKLLKIVTFFTILTKCVPHTRNSHMHHVTMQKRNRPEDMPERCELRHNKHNKLYLNLSSLTPVFRLRCQFSDPLILLVSISSQYLCIKIWTTLYITSKFQNGNYLRH